MVKASLIVGASLIAEVTLFVEAPTLMAGDKGC
jgi:hypothetical protein